MASSGLLQPIAVREIPGGRYELVAGERRLRAATRLGWSTIAAVVRKPDQRDMLVLALVENLQRADLHPLDEASGYQRLATDFSLTHPQIAEAVGKDRSTVANLLRILSLPEGVRNLLRENKITLGHARALLALPDDRTILEAARQVVERHLSVRDVERLARENHPAATPATRRAARAAGQHMHAPSLPAPGPEVRRLTELLRKRLQTDVQVVQETDAKGEVRMAYYSLDDLQRLGELILGRTLDDE